MRKLFFTSENHLITDNEIIGFAKLVEVVAINLDSLIYVLMSQKIF